MATLQQLTTTAELVKALLEEDEQCRNNDGILLSRVYKVIGDRIGVNLEEMSVLHFFQNIRDFKGIPSPETVRRTRQKVQEDNPELAATERVRRARGEQEINYRAFARCEV